jgi:hypothetical protein
MKISDQNFQLSGFFEKLKKMATAIEKNVLETRGFHQKLSFNVLLNFAHVSNLKGQRSRSFICSRNVQKIISK